MSAGPKPYPAYKDSGAAWLGAVPQHWSSLPNRALFSEVKERDHPEEQMLSVTITQGVIKQSALLQDSSKKDSSNEDKSAYKLVCPGDVTYNKMRAWQGAVGVSNLRGIISPAYVVLRLRDSSAPRYFHHLFRTPGFAKEAERWSYGITSDMWSLRPEHFKLIRSCVPPLAEQSAIVCYLDHMDRRIRRYMGAKQKLILLLQEQKRVIIDRVVTGKVDIATGRPYPAYKASGVEWLKEMPKHWEVRRLKQCAARFYSGGTPDSGALSFYCEPGSGIPWLMIADMTRQRRVRNTMRAITEEGRASRGLEVLPAGTLLYSMYASLGAVSILEIDAAVNQAIIGVQLRASVMDTEFALYYLESLRSHVIRLASASTQANLNAGKVRSLPVLVPPLLEQASIAQFLDNATANADSAIVHAESEIVLLREYRTRLIADVVTGKLDVREAAANLPDEADEPEPLRDEELLAEADEASEAAELEPALVEAEV